jgi:hypothetical protein
MVIGVTVCVIGLSITSWQNLPRRDDRRLHGGRSAAAVLQHTPRVRAAPRLHPHVPDDVRVTA